MADEESTGEPSTVRVLPGMSGARVVLMTNDSRHWFVRKIAKEPARNDRLRGQLAKQTSFGRAISSIIQTPQILDQGEIDGCFYFDMQFIRGADGVTFLREASNQAVIALADRLCEYLELVARLAPARESAGSLFEAMYSKLCEVQRKTSLLDYETLARMFTALERVREAGPTLRPTLCHGDLTLENLMIDDQGRVWMIDVLDAPFEHYWHDIAKLHQDLEGGWYLLGQRPIAKYVLEYVSRRIADAARALDPNYLQLHAILLACTFARILPYTRNAHEQNFVRLRVEHFARLAGGESS